MFSLIKRVLATHATQGEEKQQRTLDVKLVALKLREMQLKINCTLQGNYFSRMDQKLALKLFTEEGEKTRSQE